MTDTTTAPDPMIWFPPGPSCWACLGSGWLQFANVPEATPCVCVQHDDDCDPDGCSPECLRRKALRDETVV